MEHKSYFKNKAGSKAVTTHSDNEEEYSKGTLFRHYSFALQTVHQQTSWTELIVDIKYMELRGKEVTYCIWMTWNC